MPTVTVHLHTVLQRQSPDGPVRRLEVELPPAATVATLLHQLEIDYPEPLLVVVNGRQAKQDHVLRDGDEAHLVPPISGGQGRMSEWRINESTNRRPGSRGRSIGEPDGNGG